MYKLTTTLIVSMIALAAAGCGSSKSSTKSSSPYSPSSTPTTSTSAPAVGGSVQISAATVSGLGSVLVNAQGRTLYVFAPDNGKKVTCVGACAAVWPPAFVPSGRKPLASGSVKQALLGTDPDPAGGSVVTYAGWPLYTYVADTAAGMASGQALNLNGGLWYVISPSGKVITKKP